MTRDSATHTRTIIHTHAHKRATGKTEIAMLDASGAVYPALLYCVQKVQIKASTVSEKLHFRSGITTSKTQSVANLFSQPVMN